MVPFVWVAVHTSLAAAASLATSECALIPTHSIWRARGQMAVLLGSCDAPWLDQPVSSSKKGGSGAPLSKSQKSTQISPNTKGAPLGRLILIVFSKNPPSPPTLSR